MWSHDRLFRRICQIAQRHVPFDRCRAYVFLVADLIRQVLSAIRFISLDQGLRWSQWSLMMMWFASICCARSPALMLTAVYLY
jgi:hypothetical protein